MEEFFCPDCSIEMEFVAPGHVESEGEFFLLYYCPCCENTFEEKIKKVEICPNLSYF